MTDVVTTLESTSESSVGHSHLTYSVAPVLDSDVILQGMAALLDLMFLPAELL